MRGLMEVVPIQDTFCSGLGAIEKLEGGSLRFYFYATQEDDDGIKEKVVVAKLIMHSSVVPDGIMQTLAALSPRGGSIIPLVPDLVN